MPTSFQSTVSVPDGTFGNASIASDAGIATSKLETRDDQIAPISLLSAKTHDALLTDLPTTAAADDLALIINGSWGTDAPTIQAGDIGGSSGTRYAFFYSSVPQNYKDGGTFQLRVRGGMLTTVADTTCTVDFEVYKPDGSGAVGSDLNQTAATSINSLTFANYDFTILASSLDPGDELLIRMAIAYNDAGDAGVMTPEVTELLRVYQSQG